MFQFQKVQLKFGPLCARRTVPRMFQFQKVQLKYEDIDGKNPFIEFQFQKVQLKLNICFVLYT